MRQRVVAVYLSEHGFGHAVRSLLVLQALAARRADVRLEIATRLPRWLFRGTGDASRVESMALAAPLVQHDAIAVDHPRSLRLLDAVGAEWEREVERQRDWLRAVGAHLVYLDVPALPAEAAAAAAIPSVGVCNFTWDWVYRQYESVDARYSAAARRCAIAYRKVTRMLTLPTFPSETADSRYVPLPWVTRSPCQPRPQVRHALGLDSHKPVVLLSFGGHPALSTEALAATSWARGVHLLAGRQLAAASAGVHVVDEDDLARAGIGYIDLVAAADVVVTKPGYGIIADCLSARTRLVALARPEFPEAALLLEPAMRELLGAVIVPVEQRNAQGLIDAVDQALARPPPGLTCPLDGVERAVAELESML